MLLYCTVESYVKVLDFIYQAHFDWTFFQMVTKRQICSQVTNNFSSLFLVLSGALCQIVSFRNSFSKFVLS